VEICKGIHQLKVPIPDNPLEYLNAYLIEGREGFLMIDTGWYTPEAFSALKKGVKGLGIVFTDIADIVVTHVHPDHYGLVGRIKQASPQTRLSMHRWEASLIEPRYIEFSELSKKTATMLQRHGLPQSQLDGPGAASMSALKHLTLTLPDSIFHGGEIITTGIFDLEIIWTPGHAPGHICLYESENQLLFSGDHVLPVITPNVSYHIQSGDNPLGDYLSALHKLKNLPVKKVLPAHEEIFTDLPTRMEEIAAHHQRREAEIRQTIAEEPHSAYEISSQITWEVPDLTWEDFPPMLRRSAIQETIAHLEYMRWEGTVSRIIDETSVSYLSR